MLNVLQMWLSLLKRCCMCLDQLVLFYWTDTKNTWVNNILLCYSVSVIIEKEYHGDDTNDYSLIFVFYPQFMECVRGIWESLSSPLKVSLSFLCWFYSCLNPVSTTGIIISMFSLQIFNICLMSFTFISAGHYVFRCLLFIMKNYKQI